jgi:hypothetical protein
MPDPLRVEKDESDYLCDLMRAAFARAYPDVPPESVEHMARNFAQVIGGVVDIGRRAEGSTDDVSHMDIANSMVFWCVANTHLEDFFESEDEETGPACIPGADVENLLREFAARTGDWLAGMEALKDEPELLRSFVKGSMTMGTAQWERDRGRLKF